MIVQRAARGEPCFLITLDAHQDLAGQLARSFGNDRFTPLDPAGPMQLVARHHDAGWAAADAAPAIDPRSGLPFSLNEGPFLTLLAIARASASFNEGLHPYAGLLASMHVHGLYHDQYGLSRANVIPRVPTEHEAAARQLFADEEQRRRRLADELRANPETARWVDEDVLFCNYYRLQFFDRLAVHLNLVAPELLEATTLERVPAAVDRVVAVEISPVAPGVIELSPFPFAADPLDVECVGRYVEMRPRSPEEARIALTDAQPRVQRFTLRARHGRPHLPCRAHQGTWLRSSEV